jgi:microcystin-dependent protein
MDGFIAQIMMFAGDFAPRGWAFCDGQQLAIAQNQALFAVVGTRFGGDGKVTFALPDLRGRAPVGNAHGKVRALVDRRRRPAPVRPFGADFVICIDGSFPTRP